ncbi:FMN-binding protein [Curtobacterium sp. MCBA15_001]|uniref:FMN-binding protein n=1 Tax=Curtobacterium sp. MCBA15_001 TaxID=1898731 RepID=UPI0008DDAA57|nr:FMN-binding protein [Curtobacterium sp. MCBA15_001]OIH93697.1 FMN-binding protein [Curtobacterium sp. MCBA15_001]
MRARVVAGGVVSSIAVLVIGWQLGAQPAVTAPAQQSTTSGSGTTGSDATGSSASGSTGTGSSGSTGTGSAASGTFTGTTAQTRYGPVQVQITVANGTITDVTALQLTNDGGRSVQISQQAAPILRQEALHAQSAKIQSVSGATYTSDGYTTSLQSAIDQAGL